MFKKCKNKLNKNPTYSLNRLETNLKFKVMKTITSLSILLVTILLSNYSHATENFRVSLTAKTEGKALLNVTNDSQQIYAINISDSDGNMIYSYETTNSQANFNQTLNFSKLEDGMYKMNVQMDGAKYVKHLSVNESVVSIEKSIKKTEPIFQFQNNVIKVSQLNHGEEKMSVHIYQDGSLVWDQELENKLAINKAFNISSLDPGKYNFVLISGDDIYEYQVSR